MARLHPLLALPCLITAASCGGEQEATVTSSPDGVTVATRSGGSVLDRTSPRADRLLLDTEEGDYQLKWGTRQCRVYANYYGGPDKIPSDRRYFEQFPDSAKDVCEGVWSDVAEYLNQDRTFDLIVTADDVANYAWTYFMDEVNGGPEVRRPG